MVIVVAVAAVVATVVVWVWVVTVVVAVVVVVDEGGARIQSQGHLGREGLLMTGAVRSVLPDWDVSDAESLSFLKLH